jgi:hypothetical protein
MQEAGASSFGDTLEELSLVFIRGETPGSKKIQKQKEMSVLLLRFELRILHSKCRVITTSL